MIKLIKKLLGIGNKRNTNYKTRNNIDKLNITGSYRVRKMINGKNYTKSFNLKSDAVKYLNEINNLKYK